MWSGYVRLLRVFFGQLGPTTSLYKQAAGKLSRPAAGAVGFFANCTPPRDAFRPVARPVDDSPSLGSPAGGRGSPRGWESKFQRQHSALGGASTR